MTAALGVVLLMTLLLAWISICGVSSQACVVWCLAVALGAGVASLLQRVFARTNSLMLVLSAAAVLLAATAFLTHDVSLMLGLSSQLPQSAIWLMTSLPTFVGSVICHLLFCLPGEVAPGRRMAGCVAGAALFALHAWMKQPFAVTAAVLALTIVLTAFQGMVSAGSRPDSQSAPGLRIRILRTLLNVAAGVGLCAGGMVLHRVFSVSLIAISAGAVLAGTALQLAMFPVLRINKRPWIVWFCCLCWMAVLPWCYTPAIGWNLELRATASTGLQMVLFQGLQLAVWSVPLLMATIAGCHVIGNNSGVSQIRPAALFSGAAIGWTISELGIAPTWSALAAITIIACVPTMLLWRVRAVTPRFHWLRIAGSTSAAMAVASLVICPPDLAAPSRLLFTMRPLVAVHRGIAQKMIPETDATRMIAGHESAEGTVTTWKIQANTLEFRLNGHRVGAVSTDTSTTPQPIAEVLACILPLVIHPHPGSVLLLDDYTGVARGTCEHFPLHRIVVVEPKATCVAGSIPLKPLNEQLEILRTVPEVAIRDATMAPVDVVISVLSDPLRSSSLSRLSASWFQAVSERLATDGVFCQRIRLQHVGSDSLLQLLGRVSAAFENVAVIQLVPGEIALLAGNSGVPLLDKGVLERLERQHVGRQLSRCGWDWCQVAALMVVDSADPTGLWSHQQLPAPLQAFGLRLGWETVRPVNHSRSMHQLLAPHQKRIAEAVPMGPTHEEFRRRISAYAQQVEVLTAFPDQPWVYRKSLKSEMLRNPRPPVEVMRNGKIRRLPHPLDEHRKSYLKTLGGLLQQVKSGQLSASELYKLSDFSADYEPLISVFAHYELVRLYELANHPSPHDEFRHRLHTIYFTQPGDHSVRNVVAALEQLTSQPELLAHESDRFDQLNSLIQHLIVRWEARTGFEPRSSVRMQRDVELSVRTVQTAMSQMEQLAKAAGKDRGDFLTRRHFVSKALIGPLRDYEKQVLEFRAKSEPLMVSEEELNSDLLSDQVMPMLLDQTTTN